MITAADVDREICRRSFYRFFKKAWPILEPTTKLIDNWHIKYLCDILQSEVERVNAGLPKEKDTIINIPPRCLKSSIVSIMLNAWAWVLNPSLKFIVASYSQEIAMDLTVKTRRIIQSDWYKDCFGDIYSLTTDQNVKTYFANDKAGERRAVGVGGALTGAGANFFIYDDVLNPKQADSDVERENANKFHTDTAQSRLNDQIIDSRIVVMQRLHLQDLTGYLLKNEPNKWRLIKLPVSLDFEVCPSELEQYYEDGLLSPSRLPKSYLDGIKGYNSYSGQYGQNPVARGGNMFKRDMFEFVKIGADFQADFTFSTADLAATQSKTSDYTVWSDWAVKGESLYLLWVFREKLEAQFIENALRPLLKQAAALWGYRGAYIEPKLHGIYLNQKFRSEGLQVVSEQEMKDFFKDRTKSKEDRAQAALTQLSTRKIYINEKIAIKAELVEEAISFPRAAHDDFTDTLIDGIKRAYIPQNTPQIFWA